MMMMDHDQLTRQEMAAEHRIGSMLATRMAEHRSAQRKAHPSYHIQHFGPTDPWPRGGWSLYNIDGDQIAQRIEFGPFGEVAKRHSWCGFIGCFETMTEVADAIEQHRSGKLAAA